ncbi:Chromobox protein-like protein 1-like [Aphelenchoides besseyi]|nr:Chromobox protein-like protein 1-like [Aphelenchoides besseyi]
MPKAKKNELFYVEKILDRREQKGQEVSYLVKWSGYSEQQNSWEPASSFIDTSMIEAFENERRKSGSTGKEQQKTIRSRFGSKDKVHSSSPSTSMTTSKKMHNKRPASEDQTDPQRLASTSHSASTRETLISTSNSSEQRKRPRILARRGSIATKPSTLVQPKEEILEFKDKVQSTSTEQNVNLSDEVSEPFESETLTDGKDTEEWTLEPKDFEFALHPRNGLIGDKFDEKRLQKLIKEMDAALEEIDGFATSEVGRYELSRLILVAKRPNGIVGYVRLLDRLALKTYRFECVPLEILVSLHPDLVLEYLQERARHQVFKEMKEQAAQTT